MAHEISTASGRAEAMFADKPAWHGLGTVVVGRRTAMEALNLAGLNWKVEQKKLLTPDGFEVPDRVGNFRSDTGTYLGTVSDSFGLIQNEEQAKFVDAITGGGAAVIDAAGALREGRRTWWLARLDNDMEVTPEDRVKKYILVCNGHDGSLAFQARRTPIRVVCANTLAAAIGVKGEDIRLRHTTNVMQHVEEAQRILKLADAYYIQLGKVFRTLYQQAMPTAEARTFIERLIPKQDQEPEVRGRERDQIAANFQRGRGADLAGKTRWGMYNAVAEYATHQMQEEFRGADKMPAGDKAERRFTEATFGRGQQMTQQAFKLLVG